MSSKMFLGIAGAVGVVVIAVIAIAVLFGLGVIGGGGGRTAPQDFILDDSSSVAVINVAEILASPDIPAQLASLSSLGVPGVNPDDPEDWKDEWRNKWEANFPVLGAAIELDDLSAAMVQGDASGKYLGWVFIGEFFFVDIREELEDAGIKSDSYRDFEVWGDDLALLEDNGIIIIGSFVQDVLKALDTDRGFMDDSSALKQALDKAGPGLVIISATTCTGSFFQASLNGCEAIAEVVNGGDAANTSVSATYIFSSENRAESGLDDIEDAIGDQSAYDADLNLIEADGQLVTYEVSIIGGFTGGGTGEGENPQDFILEDATFAIVLNVAAILEQEFPEGIPAKLGKFDVFKMPAGNLDEPDEWKEEWREVFADNMPDWMEESIALDDIIYVIGHGMVTETNFGLIIVGNFDFDVIRETLEELDYGVGEYRNFETWSYQALGEHTLTLLEDKRMIVFANDLVQPFLKALDKGAGFVDDSSALKQALDKSGEALAVEARPNCGGRRYFFAVQLRGCEAAAEIIRGGDAYTTEVAGVYAFRRETSAENGIEDIEDNIEDQTNYDADLNRIEADGVFVTYEATIHEE